MRALPDDFGHWLAGFIDGEGCFYFHRSGAAFAPPQFQLKLRDDDRAILEECVERTGLGRIVIHKRKGRSNPQVAWSIIKRADCVALVAILDRFPLRAKKSRDFAIWRQAVELWAVQKKTGVGGGGTKGFPDAPAIAALRDQLVSGRAYAPAPTETPLNV